MKKLIRLELEKTNWKPYQIATIVTTLIMLGFTYLIAAIPYLEPNDSDVALFSVYKFVIGLSMVVMMGIYTIMSATMLAKVIVDEYEKKVIVFFTYPVSRKKFLTAKIITCLLYTCLLMFGSGGFILAVFIGTEIVFPLCTTDIINMQLILWCFLNLVSYIVMASLCGILALWVGFYRKSVIATIVTSCIMVVLICQITTMTFYSSILLLLILLSLVILAFIAIKCLREKVEKMEV